MYNYFIYYKTKESKFTISMKSDYIIFFYYYFKKKLKVKRINPI
jgi:hypothetical protein